MNHSSPDNPLDQKVTARPIDSFIHPFKRFAEMETSGGILLIFSTVMAMLWANSPWSEEYFHFWHTEITLQFGSFKLSHSLLHWINDGLMAAFFFVVGLEIKREALFGELSSLKKSALPCAGALGGMIVPALIYVAFNQGTPAIAGWGVPMATDIAFAIGILMLLGSRVPISIKVFLTALAIVDDIGAILVIALFYSGDLSLIALGAGFGFIFISAIANALGVRNVFVYAGIGLVVWILFLKSGVHATVAGVLMAFTIPAKNRIQAGLFLEAGQYLMKRFEKATDLSQERGPTNPGQQAALHSIEQAVEQVQTPMNRLEHTMHPLTVYIIMPVFALGNAGVKIGSGAMESLSGPVGLGIILGLFIGKPLGVTVFSWMAVRLGLADLPKNISWSQLFSVSILAGIGFTMAIFIANLAFVSTPEHLDHAKMSILGASVLAATIGLSLVSRLFPKKS